MGGCGCGGAGCGDAVRYSGSGFARNSEYVRMVCIRYIRYLPYCCSCGLKETSRYSRLRRERVTG